MFLNSGAQRDATEDRFTEYFTHILFAILLEDPIHGFINFGLLAVINVPQLTIGSSHVSEAEYTKVLNSGDIAFGIFGSIRLDIEYFMQIIIEFFLEVVFWFGFKNRRRLFVLLGKVSHCFIYLLLSWLRFSVFYCIPS